MLWPTEDDETCMWDSTWFTCYHHEMVASSLTMSLLLFECFMNYNAFNMLKSNEVAGADSGIANSFHYSIQERTGTGDFLFCSVS